MRPPVCLGDPTSGGGEVVQCQGSGRIDGATIAVMGDLATCMLHPGRHAFVEGCARVRMNGAPVVRDGDRLACGCRGVARHARRVRG
ncbi:PAAR domain-containing protein [Stenotrophomonas sp.]|uniref:PAAR domain-containing protein n=1 Tax=Stenotrophomonas sp. TaxID=69392 RepID=UPI0028AD803D|nr:PAAR domain-containing protein [Stenotrophomonas sp.]